MLVAPQKWDYSYEPVLPAPKAAKQRRLATKSKCLIVAIIICAFLTGLALTSQVALFVDKGYQITKLKKDIQSLQTANERLKLEIDQASSLDRVEQVALNDLGMTKPSLEDMEFIPVEDNIQLAANTTETKTTVHVEMAQPSTLAIISQRISSFLWGIVEASEL